MSKVIAVIPARAGSKGIKGKNVKELAGYPLLAYSVIVAKECLSIDEVVISTDSKEYAQIAEQYGATVPFIRPANIAEDQSSDYEFVKHLLDFYSQQSSELPEFIVHIRPTTPLREVNVLEKAIKSFIDNKNEYTALRSVHEMSESAYKTFEIDGDLLKSVGSGSFSVDAANEVRQVFSKTYHANGYVDVLKTSFVLKEGKLHGDKVAAYVTPVVTEIDRIEDFEYLQYQVEKNPTISEKLFGQIR